MNIDAKLRRETNLATFDVIGVSQQVVNGYIYLITYRNQQGGIYTYRVYVTLTGEITVQQREEQGVVIVTPPVVNPIPVSPILPSPIPTSVSQLIASS